jgi:hypothetical protein
VQEALRQQQQHQLVTSLKEAGFRRAFGEGWACR